MPDIASDKLDALVSEYVDLDARRADIQTRLDTIKEELRTIGAGKHPTSSGVSVSVTPNRRFNADLAAERLPDQLLGLCTRRVVDPSLARQVLPPATYETFMTEVGQPRVTVK